MAEQWLTKTILELEDIEKIDPDLKEIKILSRETCEQIQVVIFAKDKNTLKVLTTNNFPEQLKKVVKLLEDKWYSSKLYYTSMEAFKEAMKWYDLYDKEQEKAFQVAQVQREAAGRGALNMIKQLFDKRDTMDPWNFIMEMVRLAFQSWASDLHFQPEESGVLMRLRVDGVLQELLKFEHKDFLKYLQKMKFIAGTKMNVWYIPQDWRFSFDADVDGEMKQIDARVNFMPGMENSESTVIRFLDGTKWIQTFDHLGFEWRTFDILKKNLEKNIGMNLVTGPTGSWKTTTLYSILHYLNSWKEKIITLEDPVEYQVSGLQQSQINESKGYTYALGLKAILRHDPDIILVWETRTLETAEISINAALTGHLVFTTLHTNSAIESISRLLSMQRLVRRVCDCAKKREATYAEKSEIEHAVKRINEANPSMNLSFDGQVLEAVWCEKCNYTGYKWRLAVVEVLDVTTDIKTMIIDGRTSLDMYGKARETWFLTLREDWIIKMLDWKTTLDELRRAV